MREVTIVPVYQDSGEQSYVNMKVLSDDEGVFREVQEHFTFEIENAQFHPLVKARRWDGKIRLMKPSGVLYRGLKEEIQRLCKEREINVVDGLKDHQDAPDVEKVKTVLSDLKQSFPHAVRDYQLNAWYQAIKNKRLTLVSPTASGKSLIIYLIYKYFSRRTLLIVPTTNLVVQMKNDFISYGCEEAEIQILMSGESKDLRPESKVLISTWQSLAKLDKAFLQQFSALVCDEVHRAAAKTLTKLAEAMPHADVRIGTTGSLDNIMPNRMTIQGLFGPIRQVIKTKELMDKGQISDLMVHMLLLDYTKDERSRLLKESKHIRNAPDYKQGDIYRYEMEWLIDHQARRNFIQDFVMDLKGNTMVLFNRVEKDGVRMFDEVMKRFPERKVFLVHGGTSADDREEVRQILEKENNAVVIASTMVFSTGVNIRNLHNAIAIASTKSIITVLQSIGRILRLNEGKIQAHWFDVVDDLSVGKHKNYALKHAEERLKIYQSEQFTIKTEKHPVR